MKTKVIFSIKHAFSLIELLVAIVIASAIVALGYQSYFDYIMRGKVTDAIRILDEYQYAAMSQFQKTGSIIPYYVLFPDGTETGWVSGTPLTTSAVKNIGLKNAATIIAKSGTSGSNTYILLGVGLVQDNAITAGADHVYMAAIITPAGVITWKCGISAGMADTINTKYLPNTCKEALP